MPSAFKQTCICRKAKRKRVGESGWEGEGWVGGLTLGRGDRESFFHTQLSWDRMGLPAQGQKKDDGKKRFCCRSFPYVVSRMGGENVSSDFVMAQKKTKNTNLMRRRTLQFPTTKSSCGTRWGKKRKEWLYPCLEDGRRMMEEDTGGK